MYVLKWIAHHLTLKGTIRSIGSRPKLELAMANQPNARQASFNCVLDRAHGARRHMHPRVSTVQVSLEIIVLDLVDGMERSSG